MTTENQSPTAQSWPSDRAIAKAFREAFTAFCPLGAGIALQRIHEHAKKIDATTPPAGARDAVADGEKFADWLAREMPPGTTISNPYWWAPRIIRALAALDSKVDGGDAFCKLYEPDEYEDAFKGRDLKEAMDLAEGIWRIHYTEDAPNFQPDTTISGCLSQISNMVTGLDRNHRILARVETKATQPTATGMGEGWEYLTYRVEWQVRSEYVDQYGSVAQVYAKKSFQTQEAAKSYRATIAEPHKFVKGRWTPNDCKNDYAQCSISRVEVRVALAAQPAPVVGGALVGSRFSIDHGIVHDRKTGKHLRGTDEYGDKAADLLAVLHELENEAFAWKYTAKAFDVSTRPAESVAQGGEPDSERMRRMVGDPRRGVSVPTAPHAANNAPSPSFQTEATPATGSGGEA